VDPALQPAARALMELEGAQSLEAAAAQLPRTGGLAWVPPAPKGPADYEIAGARSALQQVQRELQMGPATGDVQAAVARNGGINRVRTALNNAVAAAGGATQAQINMLVDGLAHWVAADVVAEAQRAVPLDVECLLDGADGSNGAASGLIAALQGQQGQQQQQFHTATIGGTVIPGGRTNQGDLGTIVHNNGNDLGATFALRVGSDQVLCRRRSAIFWQLSIRQRVLLTPG